MTFPTVENLLDQAVGLHDEMGLHMGLARLIIEAMKPGECVDYDHRILRIFPLPPYNRDDYRDSLHRMQALLGVYTGGHCEVKQSPSTQVVRITRT